jgi:tetrapyrrole methylase family protein / MazG family protein
VSLPRIVVVGLGPGGPEYANTATLDAIRSSPHRYLRTSRHPSAALVPEATTFDELYEAGDSFEDVYRQIGEALVAAATEYGEVLYAVPGSPLILERTVRYLRADDRVETTLLPAVSFLDLAYDRLGIDPVESRLRLIDGHDFATAAAGETGPLLVAHCHANWVLSDIKLAVEDATGDETVVLLQRLGTPDELITHTTWADLDRAVEADHLTSIYIPRLGAPVGHELVRFYEIVRRLRVECPWDRKQTHASLASYAVEETYELVEAIGQLGDEGQGDEELAGELGDVLLQVVLHAAIAEQAGRFTLHDVARSISEKMIRRHPHVFSDVTVDGPDEVATNWQTIKQAERGESDTPVSALHRVSGALPALAYADALSAAAAKVGFDWSEPADTLAKVAEELDEVRQSFDDPAHLPSEIGDLLFAVVNVARRRRIDPEVALRQASAKFVRRFRIVERLAADRGVDMTTCGPAALDVLWIEAKSLTAGI